MVKSNLKILPHLLNYSQGRSDEQYPSQLVQQPAQQNQSQSIHSQFSSLFSRTSNRVYIVSLAACSEELVLDLEYTINIVSLVKLYYLMLEQSTQQNQTINPMIPAVSILGLLPSSPFNQNKSNHKFQGQLKTSVVEQNFKSWLFSQGIFV